MSKRKSQLPGCIYQNKNRYWWKVKLPGTSKTKAIPLIPQGGRYKSDNRLGVLLKLGLRTYTADLAVVMSNT